MDPVSRIEWIRLNFSCHPQECLDIHDRIIEKYTIVQTFRMLRFSFDHLDKFYGKIIEFLEIVT